MKIILKTVMAIILGSFLLVGCGGNKGAKQNENHPALARLFATQLNRVLDTTHKGRRHDLVLVRTWTKQTGYAVYHDRNINEYVAVYLNDFTENHSDIGSYYREQVITNLVKSEEKSEIYFYTSEGNWIVDDYIYTDPNTGREYSDLKDTYSYYTGMELGFMEESKVEKFSEILRTQFNVSEDKAPVMAGLAIEFANLDPDSLDRETANWYAQEMLGVSFDEVEEATGPVEIHRLFVQAATHMDVPTQNAYNLMGLFFLR